MYDNIGVNKQKRFNHMKRTVRIPKMTNRNYYLYSYDYDDNYEQKYKNYYENEYDYDNDEYKDSCLCDECLDQCTIEQCECDENCNCEYDEFEEEYCETIDFIKKTAMISAGVLIGATAISVLLAKRR